ncbi:MAG: Druantia anti-phage system protein DruA [Actinomycetota bacterium]
MGAVSDALPWAFDGSPCPPGRLEELRAWMALHPGWSRYRLSRELCARWGWVRPNGQVADMAARQFLLRLHERGLVALPPCRRPSPNRMRRRRLVRVPLDRTPVHGALARLGPLALHEVGADAGRRAVFETLLAEEHYLGHRGTVGENLKYLLCDARGRPLAAWLFGSAAWRCGARDRWIGWTDAERLRGLSRVANNTRFLIPSWVRVPGLASWGWSRVRRRLVADWRAKYGHGIELVETFVDRGRFGGTCYAASNWVELGLTRGRGRGDRDGTARLPVKAVYACPLHRRFRERLRA